MLADCDLDQPMLESRHSDNSCIDDHHPSTEKVMSPSKRVRESESNEYPGASDDLQGKLAKTMYSCLNEFTTALSQQFLTAQDEERTRFSNQWTEMSNALNKVVNVVESRFDENQTFRMSVVEKLNHMTQDNEIRRQEIKRQELRFDSQDEFRGSVVEALHHLSQQADVRHKEVLQQVHSLVVPQESVNPYDAMGNCGLPRKVKIEEGERAESSSRVRVREANLNDSYAKPDTTYSMPSQPSNIGRTPDWNDAPSSSKMPEYQSWEKATDIPWQSTSMLSRETRLHKLNPPPKFEAKQLDSWFRHMKFWRQLYSSVDESQILAAVGLAAGEETRDILMDYLDETKDRIQDRSLNGYLMLIHKEFGQIHEVERMDKMQEILNFKRKPDMTVRVFWQKLNRLVQYAKQSDVRLPPDILFTQTMYALLLTNAQKHLVLSHFENTGNQKTIENLRTITLKLFGSYQSNAGGVLVVNEESNDEVEEISEDENPDTFLMRGKPKKKSRPGFEEKAVKRSSNVLNFQNGKTLSREQVLAAEMKRRASTGSDQGQTRRCLRCGSPDHFWRSCPHPFNPDLFPWNGKTTSDKNADNRSKSSPVKQTLLAEPEDETNAENIVEEMHSTLDDTQNQIGFYLDDLIFVCSAYETLLFTHKTDLASIVLDTGATSSVCSIDLVKMHFPLLMSKIRPSGKSFRFGDEKKFPSLGRVCFKNSLNIIDVDINDSGNTTSRKKCLVELAAELVDASIPFLLSREALAKMSANICFKKQTMCIHKMGSIQLSENHAGHLILPFDIASSSCRIYAVDEEDVFPAVSTTDLSVEELKKLHYHLGHATLPSMLNTLKASKKSFRQDDLLQVFRECTCSNSRPRISSSVAHSHRAPFPGYLIYIDIVYLQPGTGHDFPYLFVIDGFSRFVSCILAESLMPDHLIILLHRYWIYWLGVPKFICRDGGPGTRGRPWNKFAQTFGVCLITSPTGEPSQMGALERHVALLKVGIERIRTGCPDLSFEMVVINACVARNHTILLGSGVTPVQLVYGRSDYFSCIENGTIQSEESLTPLEVTRQNHLIQMLKARSDMMRVDADQVIDRCRQRNVPAGTKIVPKIGDPVRACIGGVWQSGWRMVGLISSNALIERDEVIRKIGTGMIRCIEHDFGSTSAQLEKPCDTGDKNEDKVNRRDRSQPSSHRLILNENGEKQGLSNTMLISSAKVLEPTESEGIIGRQYLKCVKKFEPSNMPGMLMFHEAAGVSCSLLVNPDVKVDSEAELFDPARLPPKYYLANSLCKAAIIKEINDLMKPGKDGIRPLVLVKKGSPECKNLKIIRSTLVVRWKGPNRAKARLCIRGDTVQSSDVFSSPTPYRSSLKTLIMLAGVYALDIMCVDISQAFVQSRAVSCKDQMLIRPPECLAMPWNGGILEKKDWLKTETHYFLMQKPLYGLADSPLRWFVSLCDCLRSQGYHQCRSDICVFSYFLNGLPDTWVLIYVDDILVCYGSSVARDRFLSTISVFNTGEVEYLRIGETIQFLGLDLEKIDASTFGLSQKTYISRLTEADLKEILVGKTVTTDILVLRKFFKSQVGKLLWLMQTRFDLSFNIIECATCVSPALNDSSKIMPLVRMINRVIKMSKCNEVLMRYGRIPGFKHLSACAQKEDMSGLRIFTFSDAGFASIRGEKSVEASLILCGKEVSRDGSIRCMGSIIDSYARCISRCVRSTLAAESVACANSIEDGLWHRTLIMEVLYGVFVDSRPSIGDPFCLNNPFDLPPDDIQICEEDVSETQNDDQWSIDHELFMSTQECKLVNRDRNKWLDGGAIYQQSNGNIKPDLKTSMNVSKYASIMIQIISLTDSANVYTSAITLQPRTVDKLTKITLSFIRDLVSTVHFSFLDAHFNPADAGTKHGGNRSLFQQIVDRRSFVISFLGRKEIQRIKERKKLAWDKEPTISGNVSSSKEIQMACENILWCITETTRSSSSVTVDHGVSVRELNRSAIVENLDVIKECLGTPSLGPIRWMTLYSAGNYMGVLERAGKSDRLERSKQPLSRVGRKIHWCSWDGRRRRKPYTIMQSMYAAGVGMHTEQNVSDTSSAERSIDCGVLERADVLKVLERDFSWIAKKIDETPNLDEIRETPRRRKNVVEDSLNAMRSRVSPGDRWIVRRRSGSQGGLLLVENEMR